ncbi:phosphatidate cytidylyltransferase [Parasedimentitalea psychrophila]|uniref:Phosphatidate cytidylyltransferase n=1 Tax=Parasedimentitalea psychrophila TaxID=2997337 RepID=A0A9Y2KZ96_9RHOB|nr:phosphatidate cytidylyltransferase [Parasedimentitalea psychrophila]WIY24612.1 phosphatidate cytidylyltransferase [Parasedimentitalea psychrophila]
MNTNGRWADLAPRFISAIVMLVLGSFTVFTGGLLFDVLIALCCGVLIWELVRMLAPEQRAVALQLGLLSGAATLAAALLAPIWTLPLLVAPALVGLSQVSQRRLYYFGFALWVLIAGFGFIWLRNVLGIQWVLWLVCVVVVTDVAGYFAGKLIGGPKFWPRVSPKKTWSGTAAGWIAAVAVGMWFARELGLGPGLVVLSFLVSIASQAGDVAESALKRKMGVKDSSALIPGHGGFFDRFDGMLGAAAMVLIFLTFWGLPSGTL